MDLDPGSKRTVRLVAATALLLLGAGQIAEGLSRHLGYTLFFGIVAVSSGVVFLFIELRRSGASSGPQRPDL